MKEDLDRVVPELLAYKEKDRWKAYCSYCSTYHIYHTLGLQQGRCPEYTPHTETGVNLVNGGRWSPRKTVKYIDRRI